MGVARSQDMKRITMDGTLTMHSALIDWRDDTARCVALFKSTQGPALEVEYRVVLTDDLLKTLAHAFVVAGVPMLRAPDILVSLPVTPNGENGNGNGNGHHAQAVERATKEKCELCGASLFGKAVPLGYCRFCRTTRAKEIQAIEERDGIAQPSSVSTVP